MATTIRRATPQDAPQAAEVFLASRATMTYLPHLHTDEETRNFIRRVVNEAETWVADRDGDVVGFAVIHDGWLHHLYVHPSRFNTNTGGTPSYSNVTTLPFDQADGCALTNPSAGVVRVDLTSSGSITVEEADGSPSYSSITTLRLDQAD